jgi:hypothetical protein
MTEEQIKALALKDWSLIDANGNLLGRDHVCRLVDIARRDKTAKLNESRDGVRARTYFFELAEGSVQVLKIETKQGSGFHVFGSIGNPEKDHEGMMARAQIVASAIDALGYTRV